eukprot:scaffold22796_cov19-Prasinocladus_malaysianus.AAC.1
MHHRSVRHAMHGLPLLDNADPVWSLPYEGVTASKTMLLSTAHLCCLMLSQGQAHDGPRKLR